MQKPPSVTRTPHPLFVLFVRLPLMGLIVLLLGLGVFSKRGWLDYRRMVDRNDEMQTKIAQLETQKKDLEEKIHALQSDPEEQERVIRQVLGYVRPEETVIEFD